jgi:serine/threonine protein kinase
VREFAGTPAYMAPEMVNLFAGPIGPRTDVYLLGETLHEVLTGAPRHNCSTMTEVLQLARVSAPPRFPKNVPTELGALCERATARDQSARPESALHSRQALDDYLQHGWAEELTASAQERLGALHERHR